MKKLNISELERMIKEEVSNLIKEDDYSSEVMDAEEFKMRLELEEEENTMNEAMSADEYRKAREAQFAEKELRRKEVMDEAIQLSLEHIAALQLDSIRKERDFFTFELRYIPSLFNNAALRFSQNELSFNEGIRKNIIDKIISLMKEKGFKYKLNQEHIYFSVY